VWTPKLLSLALVAATFALVATDLRRGRPRNAWPAVFATTLLASSTAFVFWTTSGLENALLAALGALSCVATARALSAGGWLDAAAGAVAALLALTRPDAILYVAALPLALLASPREWRAGARPLARRLATCAAGIVPLLGGYALFRRAYFGDWLPNTYYAKEKAQLASLLDRYKWDELLAAALGSLGQFAVAVVCVLALALAARGRLDARWRSLLAHLVLATAGYMLMPLDWMGEYRFATPFFLFLYWTLGEAVARLWASEGWLLRTVAAGLGLAFVAASADTHALRTFYFVEWPVVPLSEVADFDAYGFNSLADVLAAPSPSLLTPDVGGAFLYSRLRVYDLVGLCDRTAARTLTYDTPAFHRYALEELRPTFIHVHGPWAEWAVFHTSERFKQDYVPIREDWAAPDKDGKAPAEPRWADYVRRDALGPDPDGMLASLRQAYAAAGMKDASF
jgi:hypothetical protein